MTPIAKLYLEARVVRDARASRVTRRANALVLLDGGWSCQEVAAALLMDDDTIRGWHKLFEQRGIEGLTSFDMGGSAGFLSTAQEDALKAHVGATLPRSTRQVGAWIEQEFGLVYESRSGLIALLHRLGLEYHKPNVIPNKLDEDKQKAFIENYEKLLNSLGDDEAVLFADAVHPTHAARPAGCWAPKQEKLAIEQTSGRDRINIHGAIDLATGQTRMIDVVTSTPSERRCDRKGRALFMQRILPPELRHPGHGRDAALAAARSSRVKADCAPISRIWCIISPGSLQIRGITSNLAATHCCSAMIRDFVRAGWNHPDNEMEAPWMHPPVSSFSASCCCSI